MQVLPEESRRMDQAAARQEMSRWWRLVCYGEAFLYGLLHPWQSKAQREAKARDLWQKYGGRIEGKDLVMKKQKVQKCEVCEEPTGRCKDDALTGFDDDQCKTMVLCEYCYDQAVEEQRKREA